MNKQKLIDNLKQFGYTFKEYEDLIEVQLTKSFFVSIIFEDDQIRIKDKFKGWNILNGFLKFSFRQTFIYYSIALLFASFFFYFKWLVFRNSINNNLSGDFYTFIIIMSIYSLFAFYYYYIKYTGFTQLIQLWLKK